MSPIVDRTHPAWVAVFTVHLSAGSWAVQGAVEAADAAYRHIKYLDALEAAEWALQSSEHRQREKLAIEEIGLAVYGRDWLQSAERDRISAVWHSQHMDTAATIAFLTEAA